MSHSTSLTRPSIVVLTPVKNEAWILRRFLATTSTWADLIIIADQGSMDQSRAICGQFEKVLLVNNEHGGLNEAIRQELLIKTARMLIKGPKVLFALDADEILAANAYLLESWKLILSSAPGTLFRFEKVDLYPIPSTCVRTMGNPFPLAYVDDGREHSGDAIHSARLPLPGGESEVFLDDIKILHYGYTRPLVTRAKWRLYCVTENVNASCPLLERLWRYGSERARLGMSPIEETSNAWIQGWEQLGIDMNTVQQAEPFYQDVEVLKQFAVYGVRRFWFDDIWDNDWEEVRLRAVRDGIAGIPSFPIDPPPLWVLCARELLTYVGWLNRHYRLFKIRT